MRYIEIDEDRYSGIYSGAAFTAWDGEKPDEIDADDCTCEKFWRTTTRVYGEGKTPEDAVRDLLKELGEGAWLGWFRVIATSHAIIIPNDAQTWPPGWDELLNEHFTNQL